MTSISQSELVAADAAVRRMDIAQHVELADEIRAHQPRLLASVLVLPEHGATFAQLDVPIDILLVLYQAMKMSGRLWPVISEDAQERCLERVVGRVKSLDAWARERQALAIRNAWADHPEQPMLAFVFGRMKSMLGIQAGPERWMVLAALNLVECIGASAPA